MRALPKAKLRAYQGTGPKCPVQSIEVRSVSDFVEVVAGLSGNVFWFRGHADRTYRLVPGALRPRAIAKRRAALALLDSFRRYAFSMVQPRPATHAEWLNIAQHYGLPTLLLDWSENPLVALYFACDGIADGAVYIMSPTDLNTGGMGESRVLDFEKDGFESYFNLEPVSDRAGLPTVAVNPVYNSSRIARQQGKFTLHGNRNMELNGRNCTSLVCIPILRKHKARIREQLSAIGISRMHMFPEPEHLCRYLRERDGV